jgi:hypothetical protein
MADQNQGSDMPDQCIVCLENLDIEHAPQFPSTAGGLSLSKPHEPATSMVADKCSNDATVNITAKLEQKKCENDSHVARIEVCGHMLHDSCLREWTETANSCPICRQAFHKVAVYDKVGGKSPPCAPKPT